VAIVVGGAGAPALPATPGVLAPGGLAELADWARDLR
jgi:hypothetical protein